MKVSKNIRWIVVILSMLVLRFWLGPALIGAQMTAGSFEPGGNCGNYLFEMPNTDFISWRLSGGTAASFEEACVAHDKCYGTIGQSKIRCDWMFWQDMRTGCRNTYQTLNASWLPAQVGRLSCNLQAETYFIVIAQPPIVLAYCSEQYDARAGSGQPRPNLLMILKECGQHR